MLHSLQQKTQIHNIRDLLLRICPVLFVYQYLIGPYNFPVVLLCVSTVAASGFNIPPPWPVLAVTVPTEHALAMKADLAIPWNKLRALRRYC